MSNIFKAMKAKKKRAVNPDAPPRPNLMSHDVKIRDHENTMQSMQMEIHNLKDTVRMLKHKLDNQTAYLQAVHQKLKN
jgi:predicted RNase H-like nuclease (RuvC/YqgF family)